MYRIFYDIPVDGLAERDFFLLQNGAVWCKTTTSIQSRTMVENLFQLKRGRPQMWFCVGQV